MLDFYGLGGVLADDMSLGKTIQTISFLLSIIENKVCKYIVICRSSVVFNLEREFKQFASHVDCLAISGLIEERNEQLEYALNDENLDVLITSYPLIQRDIEHYKKYVFQS